MVEESFPGMSEVVARAESGSREAFDALISRIEEKVLRTALWLTRNRADAQDVAQEVYIKVFRGLHTCKDMERFDAWVYRITTAIKQYDVPNKTIEFQFFLVKAGNGVKNTAQESGLPEKVQTALNDLAGLTRYKEFELIDAPFVRTREGGKVELAGQGQDVYTLSATGVNVSSVENKRQIRISGFTITFSLSFSRFNNPVGFTTSLEFPEGDMAVIGTTQIPDEDNSDAAIIVIVTAKIL